ncbi:MAG: chromate transporter [Dongiales bacterium]
MGNMESTPPDDRSPPQPVSLLAIALLFARVGVTSFGGGLSAWIYLEVVHRRRWLREEDFFSGLTLSQIMPGVNVVNLTLYVGQRLRGGAGVAVAMLAFLLPPMVLIVVLAGIYDRIGDNPWVHQALGGMAAAAAGLTVSMGVKAGQGLRRRPRLAIILIATFVTVGVLRWPMIPVVLCLAPLSVLLVWRDSANV